MKTRNLLGMLFLCLISLTACDNKDDNKDDDEMLIWDFAPIVLNLSVQDAQGNDLLNPETEGSIANQGIKAIYHGEIYEKDSVVSQTKAYLAQFAGLQTSKSKDGKYYLTFGEFNGDDTFDNEQVEIDWNDGTKDEISFSSKLTWKSKKEPVINRKFTLNGKEIDSEFGYFVIVKEKNIK